MEKNYLKYGKGKISRKYEHWKKTIDQHFGETLENLNPNNMSDKEFDLMGKLVWLDTDFSYVDSVYVINSAGPKDVDFRTFHIVLHSAPEEHNENLGELLSHLGIQSPRWSKELSPYAFDAYSVATHPRETCLKRTINNKKYDFRFRDFSKPKGFCEKL